MEKKWDRRKKFTFWISLSVSITLFLITVLLVLWFILLSDRNRTTHVRSDAESAEIIKKNYIKGFENISTTGEFSFRFREDEINDLLYDGVQSLNDKHISAIYYEKGEENNNHVFYVDLKKTLIKTRVIISTSAEQDKNNPYKVNLCIDSVTMGKLNASRILKRKGYLTSNFVNKYFETCNLPISFNDTKQSFEIETNKYLSMFPEETFTSLIWKQAKNIDNCLSINPSTLGLKANFSKLRTNYDSLNPSILDETPKFYTDLLEVANTSAVDSWPLNVPQTIYQISEKDFNTMLTKSLPSNKKEVVTSTLTSSKAVVDIVKTSTKFVSSSKINVGLIVSINDYLVDANLLIDFEGYEDTYFDLSMFTEYVVTFANNTYENETNSYVSYFTSYLAEIFKNMQEKQGNFFSYSESQDALSVSLDNLEDETTNNKFKLTHKNVELNPVTKTIDFIATKVLDI